MKVCEKCGDEIYTRDGDNVCESCEREEATKAKAEAKRKAAAARRKARDQVMRDLGLVKVRGALGGVYWE